LWFAGGRARGGFWILLGCWLFLASHGEFAGCFWVVFLASHGEFAGCFWVVLGFLVADAFRMMCGCVGIPSAAGIAHGVPLFGWNP
jgi:hypothetical protein